MIARVFDDDKNSWGRVGGEMYSFVALVVGPLTMRPLRNGGELHLRSYLFSLLLVFWAFAQLPGVPSSLLMMVLTKTIIYNS